MAGTLLFFLALCLQPLAFLPAFAATFTNNASIKVDDPSNALTTTNGTFTVSCWFRMAIPTGVTLSDHMLVVMDRTDGNDAANHSYSIRYNYSTGDIEFMTRGTSGSYTKTLLQRPFLERWYHAAVVRSGSMFTFYLDGRPVITTSESGSPAVGTTTGAGLAIGGVSGTSKLFYGEIIELAYYSSALSQSLVQDRMFKDQRSFANLRGYYKLGYSAETNDFYRNFVPTPPPSTTPAVKQGTGNLTFEETDAAGEQSIFDSRKNKGEDALAPLSGAFSWQEVAFGRPVPGIPFDFRFGYSSATPTQPPTDGSTDPYDRRALGPGWRHTFDSRVVADESLKEFKLITWDGGIETWTRSNLFAPFSTRHNEYRGELVQIPTAEVEWTTPDRLVYRFQDPTDGTVMAGRLLEIRDFNRNRVQLQWNVDEAQLTNVIDTAGGHYTFNYHTGLGLLTNVTFGAWRVNFAYDATNRLIAKSFTNTSGLYTNVNTTWQFAYNATNDLLEHITDPRGNTNVLVAYDKYGRKIEERDALNRLHRTEYGVPIPRQIRETDPDGFPWIETHDRKGRVLAQRDPLGYETRYTYDDFGNRTSITDANSNTTLFAYDERANVVASTNALGEVTRWVFHPFFNKAIQQITPQPTDINGWTTWTNFYEPDNATGNLLRHYDVLGTLVSYTYRTNGLVETSTDANGGVSRFAYATNGFLIASTDPATNATRFAVNDVGWNMAVTNALDQVTTHSYDFNGNVVRTTDPLNRTFLTTYDPNGNRLTATDGKGQISRYSYDAEDQLIQTLDRAGATNRLAYTLRGKLQFTTNALGYVTSQTYDNANRLIRTTDPLGNSSTNVYDPAGNLSTVFDPLNQRWSKTYDHLNRVVAETDPLGNTRQTTYDVAGRIRQVITPNGHPSTHDYDGRGRLAKWTDAEGYVWKYAYDGNGNILDIEDALHGHYVMAYGQRNERTLERNQDAKEWRYTYDALLRLKQQTDPNGLLRTYDYDAGGRIETATFSTGRINAFTWDDNDNPEIATRLGSGPTTTTRLQFDPMDRVLECRDHFNQVVAFTYDPLGRRTSLAYPSGKTLTYRYDPLDRLTNQVFQFNADMAFTNDYAYDRANRLTRRAYPNGVVQSNAYGSANQLIGLSYSSLNPQPSTLNIALTYAYDRNGNKTVSTEQGTLEWPMPALTDETARYTPSGRLIDHTVHSLAPTGGEGQGEGAIVYHYDECGNMTNATGNGQSWTLAYDEDNRTTVIVWTTNGTARTVLNRFDALGRRVARTLDGTESRYVLDLGGGMERILCDLNPSGGITAWYIHGPDLCYKVDIAGALTCYHADAQANIIALTGSGGSNLTHYAYSPHGRVLASTNFTPSNLNFQPYTFVGSQGVMEEFPGLYFMRARYYSVDDASFLSTDPVKRVVQMWKPIAYEYGRRNPLKHMDPKGEYTLPVDPGIDFFTPIVRYLIKHGILPPGDYTPPNQEGESIDEAGYAVDEAGHIVLANNDRLSPVLGMATITLSDENPVMSLPNLRHSATTRESTSSNGSSRKKPMPSRVPTAANAAEASNTQNAQCPASSSSGKSGGGGSGGGSSKSPYGSNVKYDSYGNAYYQKGSSKDYETASWQARGAELKARQAAKKKKTSSRRK